MADKRSAKLPQAATARVAKVRQIIAVSILRSISVQGATNAAAARWIGVSERTLFDWVHCVRPANVELVLACPQLADLFRQELCVHDHGIGGAPYIAKKRRGGK